MFRFDKRFSINEKNNLKDVLFFQTRLTKTCKVLIFRTLRENGKPAFILTYEKNKIFLRLNHLPNHLLHVKYFISVNSIFKKNERVDVEFVPFSS